MTPDKPPLSSFPFKPFSHLPFEQEKPAKLSPEEIDQELDVAMRAEDPQRALEVLDMAPRWMSREPGFMVTRASMLIDIGQLYEALHILQEIERKNPKYQAVHPPLAILYSELGLPALTEESAARALAHLDSAAEEMRPEFEKIAARAREIIEKLAGELDQPYEVMARASVFHEQAEIALEEGQMVDVDHFAREAIKIIPHWNAPYNNRSRALYFSGRMDEGVTIAEGVLARDPENLSAHFNLVFFMIGLDQAEKAGKHAAFLRDWLAANPPQSDMIEKAVWALAMVEDTQALWALASRNLRKSPETYSHRTWHIFAVAAIRSGKWKEARTLLRKTRGSGTPVSVESILLEELEEVYRDPSPRLEWMPPAYPGFDLLSTPKVMREFDQMMSGFSQPLTPSQKQKFDSYFKRYPFVVAAFKRMLWDPLPFELALSNLIEMNRPDADAEIMRFAMSQTGPLFERARAITSLFSAGRYDGPKIVKMWDDERGEWRDEQLRLQKIGPVEPVDLPETIRLVEKAHNSKKPAETIALLRRAVEQDPQSAMAVFNLGVVLAQNGEREEGEALIYRSVEIDPGYIFGHASIALTEARVGNDAAARQHLDVVWGAETIHPEAAVIANAAEAFLALADGEERTAFQYLQIAMRLNSDHPMLKLLKQMFDMEDYEDEIGA